MNELWYYNSAFSYISLKNVMHKETYIKISTAASLIIEKVIEII